MQDKNYNYSLSKLTGWIYSVNGGTEGLNTTAMSGWYQTSSGTVPRDLRITWLVEGMSSRTPITYNQTNNKYIKF